MDRVSLTFSAGGQLVFTGRQNYRVRSYFELCSDQKIPGRRGKTDMKRPGILVGKFESNPFKGDQSGCGLNFFISSIAP